MEDQEVRWLLHAANALECSGDIEAGMALRKMATRMREARNPAAERTRNPFIEWSPEVEIRGTKHHVEIRPPVVMEGNDIFFFERLLQLGLRYLSEGARGTIICEKIQK